MSIHHIFWLFDEAYALIQWAIWIVPNNLYIHIQNGMETEGQTHAEPDQTSLGSVKFDMHYMSLLERGGNVFHYSPLCCWSFYLATFIHDQILNWGISPGLRSSWIPSLSSSMYWHVVPDRADKAYRLLLTFSQQLHLLMKKKNVMIKLDQ